MIRWVVRWGVLAVLAGVSGALWIAWPTVAQETGPQKAASLYGYPYPDAPDCVEGTGSNCAVDRWRHRQGQCTSWVAFRLNKLLGGRVDTLWGDAKHWGPNARREGIRVDGRPAVGAVAWYADGELGHVAFVERVISPRAVVISELNYDGHNGFRTRTITTGDGWPTGFIHVGGLSAESSPEAPGPDGEVQTQDDVFILERDAERLLDAA